MSAPTDARARLLALFLAAGLAAPPVMAAPSEGCTKGPAEAIRSGDAEAAEDALRKALADSACGPVAPELRLRLAQVLGDNHGGEPGPACEAMGLFRRIAAESDDPLVQSDAAARADRLGAICAGEGPKGDPDEGDPDEGPSTDTVPDGPADAPPDLAAAPPARAPGPTEWALVGAGGGLLLVGGVLIVLSFGELEDRDAAHRAYLAAPFGSAEEAAAAQRFEDEQTAAQILVGCGVAAAGIGAALGITAVAMWPDGTDAGASVESASARLVVGPTGVGVVGRW